MGPWAFGLSLLLLSALGLAVHGYVLLVILGLREQTQQQRTANTLLLIHFGAVEAAVCLVLLVFGTGGWSLSGGSCVVQGFLLAVLHPVALWTVTGLNCDRYCAIAAPLHYAALVSPRRVSLGLAASWTGAVLLSIPPFSGIVPPYKYNPGLGCCAPDFGNGSWGKASTVYGVIYAFLGLALPALLVTICNLRVLGIARYHRHRIASAIYEVTLSAQVTITHQRNPFFVPTVTSPSAGGPPPRFHSAASTVMQLVGSLYLLYMPYCVIVLWEAIGAGLPSHQHHRTHSHPRLASLASLLLASSSPINGLLYGLKSPTLRRSIRNYWRKKVTKSALQQEIQARTPSVAGSRRPSGSGPGATTGVSLFPFPPLQRRLSEALIGLADTTRNTGAPLESGNIATFHRSRLHPAASCNTLRVPTSGSAVETSLAEIRGTGVRAMSASAASLIVTSAHRRNDSSIDRGVCADETTSPRILVTRAHSAIGESRYPEKKSPTNAGLNRRLPAAVATGSSRCQKRRWRHVRTGSDSSSTESSDASVWTTGVTPKIARVASFKTNFGEKRSERVGGSLEEARCLATANSESSDCTDTTTTTLTLSSKITNVPVHEKASHDEGESRERRRRVAETGVERSESEPTSGWSSSDEATSKLVVATNYESRPVTAVATEYRRKSRNASRSSHRGKNKREGSLETASAEAHQRHLARPLFTLS